MNIHPELQVKKLASCAPGELVRVMEWEGDNLALVAKPNDKKAQSLIMLEMEGQTCPFCMEFTDLNRPVLSYGSDYTLKLDDSENLDLSRNKLWNENGVIYLFGSKCLLRVVTNGCSSGAIFYDFETSKFCDVPSGREVAVLGNWETRTGLELLKKEKSLPIFNFSTVKKNSKE